jgi:predicted nicotinamide N-methyase
MQVLSNYIAFRGAGYLEGKKIVELGSGTGLVGLVAGALGGTVWITDQAFVQVLSIASTVLVKHSLARYWILCAKIRC